MRRKLLVAVLVWGVAAGLVWRAAAAPSPSRPPQAGYPWPWQPGGVLSPRPHFVAMPFTVRRVADPTLPRGQQALLVPGRQGIAFVGPGARIPVESPEPAVVGQGQADVHVLTVDGRRYLYLRVLTMLATAYNGSVSMNGPWGAVSAWTGQPLRRGDVAVDPAVIPLGTPLYVQGYGPAVADDTGAAISGDRIDLFLPVSSAQVAQYGMRWVKVWVLAHP